MLSSSKLPLLHRFAHGKIGRDLAQQLERHGGAVAVVELRADEAVDDELQLLPDRPALAVHADLVDDDADRPSALLHRQQLDRRVGVGHRGRLGGGDDEHVVGERDRVQDDVGDAGAGVEQDAVEARRDAAR